MIRLIDLSNGGVLGELGSVDFEILKRSLELESSFDTDYYMNEATLELLAEHGLSREAQALLRQPMTSAGYDVGWEPVGSVFSHIVRGRAVSDIDGAPLGGLKVEVFHRDFSAEHFLGWGFTRQDGSFEVGFGPSEEDFSDGIVVRTLGLGGEVLASTEPVPPSARELDLGDLAGPPPTPPEAVEAAVAPPTDEDLEISEEVPAGQTYRPLEHPLD
ncbi:MAG: hypothetical protein HY319_05820 [Armatimonadetes bacterium]|nr:hypothetical protein [Armatimonadota bacterium]